MNSGIITIDLHGKTVYQAQIAVNAALRRASAGTYRIRVIHGFHSGTVLRDFIKTEYSTHSKVRRLLHSPDGGATDLVLREF